MTRKHLVAYGKRDWHFYSFSRGLRKWISAARQKETNLSINPAPSTVESPGNMQLQKLLAKEEQRLEQEQKRAAIERRRKQQQERFQLQHELNHPLRQHHTQQKTMTLKGILIAPSGSILQALRDISCIASLKRCVMLLLPCYYYFLLLYSFFYCYFRLPSFKGRRFRTPPLASNEREG